MNNIPWKSVVPTYKIPLILGVVILVFAIGYVKFGASPDTVDPSDNSLIGKSYVTVKDRLIHSGWSTFILPEERNNPVIDETFPEIRYCGSGLDAICSVSFMKGDTQAHLDLQKGGRSGYLEWTIVGSE